MGAGWDQVRSRGPQFRSESGVDRIIRYLGGGALPAVLETVAVAVHLQDVNVVGERSSRAPVSLSEPNTSVHSSKGRLVVTRTEPPFVALAEDLEEEFRTGGGEGDEAQLVDDEKPEAGQLPLQVEQPAIVSGLHELVDQGRGGGEAYDIPFWQAARPRPRATWVLPVPLLPTAMTFSYARCIHTGPVP